MTDATTTEQTPIIARADFQYRWRVYIFFVLVFGYGLLSIRDGFFRWPADNDRLHHMEENHQKLTEPYHNEAGILINKALGIVFPLISLPAFIWLMYRSRGSYRLLDRTLSVPGHDAILLERIRSMDKSLWDRKGLAVLEFDGADGKPHNFTLRDMVYDRRATDKIVERIELFLKGSSLPATSSEEAEPTPPTTSQAP
jgi:hypothetical protein